MENVNEVLRVIKELQNTSGKNDKQDIIKDNEGNELFREVLKFLLNDYITTGISKKKINKEFNERLLKDEITNLLGMFDYLKEHNSGRDYDIEVIQSFARNQNSIEESEFISQLASKELKLGVSASTYNKVFPQNRIPVFDVMLAKGYDKFPHKVVGNFVITKKLDGLRMICIKEGDNIKFFTRTGKEYEGLNEIKNEILEKITDYNFVLDGELLADAEGSTDEVFAETSSRARNKDKDKTGLIYNIFDKMFIEDFKNGKSVSNCIDRKKDISLMFNNIVFDHLKEVTPLYIGNDKEQISVWSKYADEHEWEGIMINLDTPYVCKRTDTLLKVKKMQTCDVLVKSIAEGSGSLEGMLGAITVEFEHEGIRHECDCGSGFSKEERVLYWENQNLIINKIVEIQYFEVSKNKKGGVGLRFPVWKSRIREDKTEISMN